MGKISIVFLGLLLTSYSKTFAQQIHSITVAMEPFMNDMSRPRKTLHILL